MGGFWFITVQIKYVLLFKPHFMVFAKEAAPPPFSSCAILLILNRIIHILMIVLGLFLFLEMHDILTIQISLKHRGHYLKESCAQIVCEVR